MAYCEDCGSDMQGDGYTTVKHCENIDVTGAGFAPDHGPVFCGDKGFEYSQTTTTKGGEEMLIFGRKEGQAFTIFEDLVGIISYGGEIGVELVKIEGTKHTLRILKEYADYANRESEEFEITLEQEGAVSLGWRDSNIEIKVLDPKRGNARIGITAPNKFQIFRDECAI